MTGKTNSNEEFEEKTAKALERHEELLGDLYHNFVPSKLNEIQVELKDDFKELRYYLKHRASDLDKTTKTLQREIWITRLMLLGMTIILFTILVFDTFGTISLGS